MGARGCGARALPGAGALSPLTGPRKPGPGVFGYDPGPQAAAPRNIPASNTVTEGSAPPPPSTGLPAGL